jgi:hypothetical protein
VSSPADDTLLAECAKALEEHLNERGMFNYGRPLASMVLAIARPRIEAEAYDRSAQWIRDCMSSRWATLYRVGIEAFAKESSRATGK